MTTGRVTGQSACVGLHRDRRQPVPAATALHRLVEFARPALNGYGDADRVDTEIELLLTSGTGADEQRALVAAGADLRELTAWACDRTSV